MFKVLFWSQIGKMSHSLETKIQVVILMTKYESPVMAIRQRQRVETTNIFERHPITSKYQKFLETDSAEDRAQAETLSAIKNNKVQEIQQISDTEPVNSIRSVAGEANGSKY